MKLDPKLIKKLVIGGVIVLPILIFIFWAIGVSNHEIELRNLFNAKMTERTATYDKVWKTIAQKGKIALRNDSSFQNIVQIQMNGQKDGEQVMWKWVQQSNPAATFTEVSALYKDLSRTVESMREEFFQQEKVLQDVKLQHDNLRKSFWSSIIVGRRKELVYKPITSDRTDSVIKTGKDNNVEVFQ